MEVDKASAPFSSWRSLQFSQPLLDSIYAGGVVFPSAPQRVISSAILEGKSANFVLSDSSYMPVSAYLTPLLEVMRRDPGDICIIISADAPSNRRTFQKIIASTQTLAQKPNCAVLASAADIKTVTETTAGKLMLTTAPLVKALLSKVNKSIIRCIIIDTMSASSMENVDLELREAFPRRRKDVQFISFSPPGDQGTSLLSIPYETLSTSADRTPSSAFTHECILVSQTKTKLAALLAVIRQERNANIVILTKHSSSVHRMKHLLCAAGRNALVLDSAMGPRDMRVIHDSINTGACDTILLKDIGLLFGQAQFLFGPVTLIHYDSPISVADFIDKTAAFTESTVQAKIISFIEESQEKLLHEFRLLGFADGSQVIRTVKRDFSEGVIREAGSFIEDKLVDIRQVLSREKVQRRDEKTRILISKKADAIVREAKAPEESRRLPSEKKTKQKPKVVVKKHEKNSYHEKIARNKVLIKKVRKVQDLKGLLPKGKFRKIRKRQERIDRQNNPTKQRKRQSSSKQKGGKRSRR